jgi:hypothetical protein
MSTIKGFKIFAVAAIILIWVAWLCTVLRPDAAATVALNEAVKATILTLPCALVFALNRMLRDLRAIQIMLTSVCVAALEPEKPE